MGYISWSCICPGFPRWSLKNDQCPKCGKLRDKIRGVDYFIGYRINGKKKLEKLPGLSRKEVEAVLRDREHDITHGKYLDPTTGYLTMQDMVDAYVEYIRIESPSSYLHLKLYTDRMIKYFGNPDTEYWITHEDVAVKRIKEWKLHLRDVVNLKPATINKHLSYGKAIWNYCLRSKPNPWRLVDIYEVKNNLERYLTPEQEQKVLRHAYDNYPNLFGVLVVALSTGLRKSNVLELTRPQVDWERGTITVIQKGGGSHVAVLTDTCREILSQVPATGITCANEKSPYYGFEYFWANESTGKPFLKLEKSYKQCLRAAGIDPTQFRFHDLRHSAATKLLPQIGLYGVQKFLGHSSIKYTDRYAHLIDGVLRDAANTVGIEIPEDATRKVVPFVKRKVG